ncbi:MAG: DUF3784 domain-containing protein [Ruminococcus sp.]|nr:DUF3784 domain-containing protein [Ruminococcus sp.]
MLTATPKPVCITGHAEHDRSHMIKSRPKRKGDVQMTTVEIVMAVVMFAIAGLWLFLGIRSFMERGFLLNNAYIYATKEERKTMDKKPYYRQSAVAFCLLSVMFVIIGLSVLFQNDTIMLLVIPFAVAVVLYAVVSTVLLHKRTK